DLATLKVTSLATKAAPDQVAWAGNDAILYSTRVQGQDLTAALTAAQKKRLQDIYSGIPDLYAFNVQIQQLNLTTHDDHQIYAAPAYAIGRMAVTPDGKLLYFSQIANMNAWLTAITSGKLDPANDQNGDMQRKLVPESLYVLLMGANQPPAVVGQDFK